MKNSRSYRGEGNEGYEEIFERSDDYYCMRFNDYIIDISIKLN